MTRSSTTKGRSKKSSTMKSRFSAIRRRDMAEKRAANEKYLRGEWPLKRGK